MPIIMPTSSCLRATMPDRSDHALRPRELATESQYAEANATGTDRATGPTHGRVAGTHVVRSIRHAHGLVPVVQTVPVRTVLNRPSASLGTAEHGCVAADASTANGAITTTIPTRPATTRAKGPDGRRDNHHDSETRGTLLFLCAPDFGPSPATLLSETDGAVQVAPDPHLNILWIAKAIPEIRVRAKAMARVSQRTKAANEKAQLAEPLTAKKESRRASSIATASVLAEEHASIGMPTNAGTFLKKDIARMGTTAPTNM